MNPNQDPQSPPPASPSPLTPPNPSQEPDITAPTTDQSSTPEQPVTPEQAATPSSNDMPSMTDAPSAAMSGTQTVESPATPSAPAAPVEPSPIAAPVAPQPSLDTSQGQGTDVTAASTPTPSQPASEPTAVFAATPSQQPSAPLGTGPADTSSSSSSDDPGKTLGIVGFVLSLLGGGLISLIISVIGRNKSKKAGHSNGFALAGIIISVIGMIISAVFAALLITGAMKAAEYCQQNGSTVRNADGSVSYNCGTGQDSDVDSVEMNTPTLN